ncbi:alpha/beta hydrolase [Aeromicrobium fastidiosum]|uniref:Alpha/beta hydrolase n=1 Tax=Aeromicrobium fastidiosum TaxID=52699 RepID=A0A641AL88_9ACTN|nr:alpha/beta hydrolase [Aeromicrobium fastidiosum]KAA1376450.1 alpha/beta hydrolase [Aeromicrobium fastidiosum]MBP2391635.1 pimeloyl-ACP methyl ester carboxylesterase [Aeromicrobium fastidiosum]
MHKKIIGTLAATAVATATLSGAGISSAQASTASAGSDVSAAKSSISWGACTSARLQKAGAQCAKVSVPLDWNKPRGKKIKIAISRVKHTVKSSKYQGVMLVNPGGPGGSGLSLSLLGGAVPDYKGRVVGGAYDWIGFDPRGVGESEPAVSCDPNWAGYNRPKYDPTKAVPYRSYDKKDPWPSITNAYTRACKANNTSGILRHLTTKDVARDLNLIRQRLGASKINYFGFSYGTYLGQVFSSMFPERVRRMVFDGTVDPRGVWYEANLSQDTAFDRNINIWFKWLAKYDSTYHLGKSTKAVRNTFYATRNALYANPVTAPGGVHGSSDKLGGSEWTDAFLYAGYYESTWTDLATTFSNYVNKGDVAGLEAAYLDASGFGDDNGYAVYLGVQCTDTSWPSSWKTWRNDNNKIAKKSPFLTWSNAWYNESCRHWPAPSRTPKKIDGSKVKSVLMLNETLDAATPYEGSLQVRKLYPNASLVATQGGTTHSNSLNGYSCVDDKIARYLYNGTLPSRKKGNRADAYCKAIPQPRPEPAGAQAQAQSAKKLSVLQQVRLEQQKIAAPR